MLCARPCIITACAEAPKQRGTVSQIDSGTGSRCLRVRFAWLRACMSARIAWERRRIPIRTCTRSPLRAVRYGHAHDRPYAQYATACVSTPGKARVDPWHPCASAPNLKYYMLTPIRMRMHAHVNVHGITSHMHRRMRMLIVRTQTASHARGDMHIRQRAQHTCAEMHQHLH
jgi:hypothetical protein